MATQTTGGGSTTSFMNTPQAVDDSYTWTEEQLLASSMYNASTYTVTLDVMANDLGGKSKTLFSVEDGDGNPITADYELLNKDVNSTGVSSWEKTVEGNWVRINNGKIEFRISDGSGVPGAGVDINSLSEGESFTDEFVYAIRLGNGTLSEARVTLTITGSNDAPEVSAEVTATVDEDDSAPASVGLLANASDPDASDDLDVANVGYAVTGGTWASAVTYNVDAGTGELTFDPNQFNALAVGESVELTFSYDVVDGNGGITPAQAVVTITGSNDGPTATGDNVITNIVLGNAITIPEWALLNNDVDPDGGGTIDVSGTGSAVGGTVTHTPGTGASGTVTFNDAAPAGGSFTYTATDGTTVGSLGTVTVSRDATGSIDGSIDADILISSNGGATLIGNAGNDVLIGGSGNDTYQFGLNDGTDTVSDAGSGGDSITMTTSTPINSTSIGTLNFERVGTDLLINVGSTHITIKNHYGTGTIENFSFTNGGAIYGYALSTTSYKLSNDASSPLDGTGNEDIIASSSGTETLNGSNKNDLLFGNGGNDAINGGSGDDLLIGGNGIDTLNGGNDSDVIAGNFGNDILTGGSGNDDFVFDTAPNSSTNVDSISDFNGSLADQILMENAIFSSLATPGMLDAANFVSNAGGNAVDGNDFILFDAANGNLYYDADGSGGAVKVLFATISLVGLSGTVDASDFQII